MQNKVLLYISFQYFPIESRKILYTPSSIQLIFIEFRKTYICPVHIYTCIKVRRWYSRNSCMHRLKTLILYFPSFDFCHKYYACTMEMLCLSLSCLLFDLGCLFGSWAGWSFSFQFKQRVESRLMKTNAEQTMNCVEKVHRIHSVMQT